MNKKVLVPAYKTDISLVSSFSFKEYNKDWKMIIVTNNNETYKEFQSNGFDVIKTKNHIIEYAIKNIIIENKDSDLYCIINENSITNSRIEKIEDSKDCDILIRPCLPFALSKSLNGYYSYHMNVINKIKSISERYFSNGMIVINKSDYLNSIDNENTSWLDSFNLAYKDSHMGIIPGSDVVEAETTAYFEFPAITLLRHRHRLSQAKYVHFNETLNPWSENLPFKVLMQFDYYQLFKWKDLYKKETLERLNKNYKKVMNRLSVLYNQLPEAYCPKSIH